MIAEANGIAEKPLPAASDSETQVIGSLLLAPDRIARVTRMLRPGDFLDDYHRITFSVIEAMYRAGKPIDVVSVKLALDDRRHFEGSQISAAGYLAEVATAVAVAAHVEYFAGLVAAASRKRRLFDVAQRAADRARNGEVADAILADLWAEADDLKRESDGSHRFNAINARQLDAADYAVTWLVDWLLVEGQPCILAGGKKTLKTSLLCDLLLSLAIGDPFLGKFEIRRARRVLFCSGESGLATLQETCRRVAAAKGWNLSDIPGFMLTPDLPQLDSPADLAAFESLLIGTESQVVAIDPAYLCMSGHDAGNLFAQGALLLGIARLCQRLECTLILCHHARKNRTADRLEFDAPELEDIAWAGFAEFARQWLLTGRRERYEPGSGEHRLWLNVGGSAGHGSLWAVDVSEGTASDPDGRRWDVTVSKSLDARVDAEQRRDEAKARKEADQLHRDREAVCRALVRKPLGMTPTAIRDAASISGRRFPTVLAAMIEGDEIERCEVRVSNQITPKEGYKLKEESDA